MAVVAVTGGIAAGKSVVASRLKDLGAIVLDADQLARDAVAPGSPALSAIAQRFGDDIVTSSGELDRAALGALVFADATARTDLNSIVHPEVRRLYDQRLAEVLSQHPDSIIIYDIPLLAEARTSEKFDAVVVVHAPAPQRIQRLMEFRGFSEQDATARVQAQASDEERLALATTVIDASVSEAETIRQTRALYESLRALWPDRLDQLPREFPGQGS
jgi:dephospho-CoA kinase